MIGKENPPVGAPAAFPASLISGAETKVCVDLQAPDNIALTWENARITYAHWSFLYQQGGRPHVAHVSTEIQLTE